MPQELLLKSIEEATAQFPNEFEDTAEHLSKLMSNYFHTEKISNMKVYYQIRCVKVTTT